MRRTKIVATLGPSCWEKSVLHQLLAAGVDVVRVNLSHGRPEDHRQAVALVRAASAELSRHVGVMFDTRGPELRVSLPGEAPLVLAADSIIALVPQPVPGEPQAVGVDHPDLWREVRPGDPCLFDDGLLAGVVVAAQPGRVTVRVLAGGELRSRKKVSFPGSPLSLPTLSAADREDLALAAELGVDIVAASFMRTAPDVLELREALDAAGSRALLVAKIETREGVENVDAILRLADGLMVARGDLGVAYPPEDVPLIQKRLIAAANRLGKPVVTATQMLESMVEHPAPTRAEASDVANAIWDGSDAVMLSAETATGKHPVAAVEVMARIAQAADSALRPRLTSPHAPTTVTAAISRATCEIAQALEAKAIITATHSGHTARMVARYRPAQPIVAATPSETVARQLALLWGTLPHVIPEVSSSDQMLEAALAAAQRSGVAEEGDTVVVTFGVPVGVPGTTNLLQVHTLGGVALRGRGIGGQIVSGPVARVERPKDARRIPKGAVVVTRSAGDLHAKDVEAASALVAEEGGLTSPAAILGVSLGIPVVVGAEGALGVLRDGETVTVDARRGVVYRGLPSL